MHLVHAHVPVHVSVARLVERSLPMGRYVPLRRVLEMGPALEETYSMLPASGELASFLRLNADVPKGVAPQVVEEG